MKLYKFNEYVNIVADQLIDFKKISKNELERVWEQYKRIYTSLGMDLTVHSSKELKEKYTHVLVGYKNVSILYFFIIRKTNFGYKIALTGCEHKDLKKPYIIKLIDLLKNDNYYVEASGRLEEILINTDVNYIENEEDIKKILNKDITYLGDGYYERKLRKYPRQIKKRMYGNPKLLS